MSNEEEELERQFQADLERAKALSLQEHEQEKLRTEQRKKSIIEAWRNRPTASVTPLPSTPPNVAPLLPPPATSGRKLSSQSEAPDLISFHSPTKPEDSKTFSDLDQFLTTPVNNQPALRPSSSEYSQISEYGFKRDVLLRQNPFPQPAPILSFPRQEYPPVYNTFSHPAYQTNFRSNFGNNGHQYPPPIGFTQPSTPTGSPFPTLPVSTPSQGRPSLSNSFSPYPSKQPYQSPPNPPIYSTPVPKSQREGSFPSMQSLKSSISKKDDTNLIDLTPERVSDASTVLEAFDPLAPSPVKDDGSSIYGTYDPFDYMAGGSQEEVYAEVQPSVAEEEEAASKLRLTANWIRTGLVFDSNRVVQTQIDSFDKTQKVSLERVPPWEGNAQLAAFCDLVTELRAGFPATDPRTNPGLVLAPTVECHLKDGVNVKLVVSTTSTASPVTFACDLRTSIEHVISHVICVRESELGGAQTTEFVLKVDGTNEFFASGSSLEDYEYVYQCIKMDRDVTLVLVPAGSLQRPLARTVQDDKEDVPVLPKHILPAHVHQHPISYDTLSILLDTVEREMGRLSNNARELTSSETSRRSCKSVEQAVKALCSLMGQLETVEVSSALQELFRAFETRPRPVAVVEDRGPYSTVTVDQTVSKCCESVRNAVHSLIRSYCGAFNVDFRLTEPTHVEEVEKTRPIESVGDPVLAYIGALHRPSFAWKYPRYLVEVQVYHGTRPLRAPYRSSPCPISKSFYDRIVFNTWISLDDVPLGMLPREARLVFALFGLQPLAPDHELSKMHPGVQQYSKIELGWAAVQCFDQNGLISEGRMLLSVWPVAADKRMGPAPHPGTHPIANHPVLELALPSYTPRPKFLLLQPEDTEDSDEYPELSSLDPNTQQMLLDVSQEDSFSSAPPEEREILWEKRHYLVNVPEALPKVLFAATAWDMASLPDLHKLLRKWARTSPLAALQLLLPCFPDMAVRALAISRLQELTPDELVDYLPQLVQALKHETYEVNPLARFLLEQALASPRVAHHLFWLLVQILPGDTPQNSMEAGDSVPESEECVAEYRHHWRLRILLRALLAVAGGAMRVRLCSQLNLVKSLYDIAQHIKQSKDSLRVRTLLNDLEPLHHTLQNEPSGLPLNASVTVTGIQVRTCSYFASKTLPLKIDFLNGDGRLIPAIFKVGDDLRQDALTLQMIRVMDKLWLKEGLDLRMLTFDCVPTGHVRGMIQMITEAETLRVIQTEHGLTGSFKDRPIAEWLAKHNPGALEYARAVANFRASCAGYSVATYVLGICDRHNDNIMLNTSGHLFHIDFGKFLGDAQMFGNFKRDRAPFVLTSDMAYVINGGDRPSQSFQQFVDLCCHAFAVVRQHSNVILNLLGFMVGTGIPGVTLESMRYVQRALLPGVSRAEASASFSRLIESSLSSWFTQFNFFLHNLSQLRSGGDRDGGDLLSFVPKRHTCEEDGRIIGTQVHNVQKRYGTEKHYVYVIRVERENQQPSYIFRTYREFCELHNKICALFPLAKVYSRVSRLGHAAYCLSRACAQHGHMSLQIMLATWYKNCGNSLQAGLQIGRSAVKQVAERRKVDIEKFLVSLFKMADELAHSDIVYTFFHPLLRDQEEVNINQRKLRNEKIEDRPSNNVTGQLKLTVMYQRGTLTVMVAHARGLAKVGVGQEPNTYVKVYLVPDPSKCTKRKTKVVKRSCHPTFMEMLEYRMELHVVRSRTLEATVWSYDTLQENEFLGTVKFPLENISRDVEVSEWFPLGLH